MFFMTQNSRPKSNELNEKLENHFVKAPIYRVCIIHKHGFLQRHLYKGLIAVSV